MSRPITDPRREPPLHYVCTHCAATSADRACIVEENDSENEAGTWECGYCGNQEWRKPKKTKVGR